MELIDGRTLQELLDDGRRFSGAEAVRIGIELAQAIEAVHAAGLLHRDIKPHNVMIARDGGVVLMDFGTGRERDDVSTPGLAGTPLYMAPELLSGGAPTVQSDIYSLGVLLYHLVSRSYPVQAGTLRRLRRAHHRHHRIEIGARRRDLPRALTRVIERATDPRPQQR
jgi:eukaryotic-like serine/threonine-protein kinase